MDSIEIVDTQVVRVELPTAVVEQARARAKEASVSLEVYLAEIIEQDLCGEREPDALMEAILRMAARTPEQIQADRERVLATVIPGRPLPEGKSLFDVVGGQWPGDETDEEIRDMLEKLS